MYFILNENKKIIAADDTILKLYGVTEIETLSSLLLKEEKTIDFTEETSFFIDDKAYFIHQKSLSSLLGKLTLVILSAKTLATPPPLLPLEDTKEEIIPHDFNIQDPSMLCDTLDLDLDLDVVSQQIGISPNAYKLFLNEFIDTTLALETDLQSTEKATRENTLNKIKQLSDTLKLPMVTQSIEMLGHSKDENTYNKEVKAFYRLLSRIHTKISSIDTEQNLSLHENSPEVTPVKELKSMPNNEVLTLETVSEKHFDFQLHTIANDLSLPEELIKEFMHDFINLSHHEMKNIMKAYEISDFSAIEKSADLLKEAANNLNITALVKPLSQLQLCQNTNNLAYLIKEYWAYFIFFEKQIHHHSYE